MKKLLMLLLCLSLLLVACVEVNVPPPAADETPVETPPPSIPETPVETPAESKKPTLVLKEGEVEIAFGSFFDPVTLIESGDFDEVSFSEIDTSVEGEQELVITVTKDGNAMDFTKTVSVVRPAPEITWTMVTEGPVMLIHPDKLSDSPEEEDYKSFYEYPVFASKPPEIAEQMNQNIKDYHIWGIAEMFNRMSNNISPDYDGADVLRATTTVSEDKEAIVVHTTYVLGMWQTGYIDENHEVTIYDMATGYPIHVQQLLERYGLTPQDVVDRLNAFVAKQEHNSKNTPGVKPYDPALSQKDMEAYYMDLVKATSNDDYMVVFLEDEITIADLQAKLIFVEDGKLYSDFVVFTNLESSSIHPLLYEVGAIE